VIIRETTLTSTRAAGTALGFTLLPATLMGATLLRAAVRVLTAFLAGFTRSLWIIGKVARSTALIACLFLVCHEMHLWN
jgi:hypothetical protein